METAANCRRTKCPKGVRQKASSSKPQAAAKWRMTISHKLQAASCDKLSQGQCVMLTAKLTQGAWQKASSFKLQAASICHIFFHAGYAIIHIVGIPIEQCARTWSGDRLNNKSSGVIGVSRVSPAKSFFKIFFSTRCDILTHGDKPQATGWIIF